MSFSRPQTRRQRQQRCSTLGLGFGAVEHHQILWLQVEVHKPQRGRAPLQPSSTNSRLPDPLACRPATTRMIACREQAEKELISAPAPLSSARARARLADVLHRSSPRPEVSFKTLRMAAELRRCSGSPTRGFCPGLSAMQGSPSSCTCHRQTSIAG